MLIPRLVLVTILTASLVLPAASASAQGGIPKEKQGKGGSVVQGAAGTEGSGKPGSSARSPAG